MYTKVQPGMYPTLFIVLLAGALLLSACAPVAAATNLSTNTEVPPAGVPAQMLVSPPPTGETAASTAQPLSFMGTTLTFGDLTLAIPQGVASGADGSEFPRIDTEDAAWWQMTPGHLQVTLDETYVLQGKFHQPQIFVYPAQAYAELVPVAFESLHRINNILGIPGLTGNVDQLPSVPFFNARQAFGSNIEIIAFQGGSGVRFLTQYAQYAAPVNNHELLYHFQGLTNDGASYIIAIFPITVPVLAETSDPEAVLPPGGIAYPDITDPNTDWQGYYGAVTDLLNGTSPDAFTPTINQLDSLIRSIQVFP